MFARTGRKCCSPLMILIGILVIAMVGCGDMGRSPLVSEPEVTAAEMEVAFSPATPIHQIVFTLRAAKPSWKNTDELSAEDDRIKTEGDDKWFSERKNEKIEVRFKKYGGKDDLAV